jgi:hypothetical protein
MCVCVFGNGQNTVSAPKFPQGDPMWGPGTPAPPLSAVDLSWTRRVNSSSSPPLPVARAATSTALPGSALRRRPLQPSDSFGPLAPTVPRAAAAAASASPGGPVPRSVPRRSVHEASFDHGGSRVQGGGAPSIPAALGRHSTPRRAPRVEPGSDGGSDGESRGSNGSGNGSVSDSGVNSSGEGYNGRARASRSWAEHSSRGPERLAWLPDGTHGNSGTLHPARPHALSARTTAAERLPGLSALEAAFDRMILGPPVQLRWQPPAPPDAGAAGTPSPEPFLVAPSWAPAPGGRHPLGTANWEFTSLHSPPVRAAPVFSPENGGGGGGGLGGGGCMDFGAGYRLSGPGDAGAGAGKSSSSSIGRAPVSTVDAALAAAQSAVDSYRSARLRP